LLERFVGLMILRFRLYMSNTELAELLYISVDTGLGIVMANKF